jgi:hypothetical protein
VGAQSVDGVMDVVDGKHDAMGSVALTDRVLVVRVAR